MDDYTGYREVELAEENANDIYADPCLNIFGCLPNEYLIVRGPDGAAASILRCDGDVMSKIRYKTISSKFGGEIKPRNLHQRLAIDMLYNPSATVKVLTGPFGSGKDLLMSAAAVDLLEKERFEKIVYIRNNIEVKDSKPIGFLPGTSDDKLHPFAMPLADHLGGEDGLAYMVQKGLIEIVHLGFMRGRDIKNAILYCTEAENLTREHIRLLIGRVAEGSELWVNGDMEQCDGRVFSENNGLLAAIDKLKGQRLFSYVRLKKTERSATAALADLLE